MIDLSKPIGRTIQIWLVLFCLYKREEKEPQH